MMKNRFLLAFVFALAFSSGIRAEITGAAATPAGELVILTSDREAVWKVFPPEYSGSYAVSDDGKTVYFASSKKGVVSFVASSTYECRPWVETHTLVNGMEVKTGQPTPLK